MWTIRKHMVEYKTVLKPIFEYPTTVNENNEIWNVYQQTKK